MKLLLLLLLFPMTILSQNFDNLRWDKRIILIESASFDHHQAQQQVSLLKKEFQNFPKYKLTLIEITPNKQRVDHGETTSPVDKKEIQGFQVFLIGLDGGVKFQSSEVTTAQHFFDLIDTMPMRKNEVNKG